MYVKKHSENSLLQGWVVTQSWLRCGSLLLIGTEPVQNISKKWRSLLFALNLCREIRSYLKIISWTFRSPSGTVDSEELNCHKCGNQIELNEGLARTFTLPSQEFPNERLYARKVEVPTLSEVILVYHRDLDCFYKFARYVAISHVWHPVVAELQSKRTEATNLANEAEKLVAKPWFMSILDWRSTAPSLLKSGMTILACHSGNLILKWRQLMRFLEFSIERIWLSLVFQILKLKHWCNERRELRIRKMWCNY